MDRIDNLPNEIISHIVSFLSAKEAAFAKTLSKRWGNLFQIITKLWFDDSVAKAEGSFERFVHQLMALPVADSVRMSLTCFHASLPNDDEDDLTRCLLQLPRSEQRINRCIPHLVVKRGVLALKIILEDAANYSLPDEVFTCKTVSSMKLWSGLLIDAFPGDVFLPSLKSLYLDSVRFYASDGRCSFQTLLSASPVLEELFIDGLDWKSWKWCCTVSSTTLRRLTLRRRDWYPGYFDINVGGISFDTPALTFLYYRDYLRNEYPIVNLDSVVEGTIILQVGDVQNWAEEHAEFFNVMNLVNGIKNVDIMEVDWQSINMFYVFRKVLPVFEKLHDLSVSFAGECWNRLPNLIEKCPNLETLIISDSLQTGSEEDGFICPCVSEYSFLSPVKYLVIERYEGTIKELKQIKLLLEKTSSLMVLQINARVPPHKEARLLAAIVSLPRASTYCKFEGFLSQFQCSPSAAYVTGNSTDHIAVSYRPFEMCHDRHGELRR